MAQRGIREYDGKRILFDELGKSIHAFKGASKKLVLVAPETAPVELLKKHPWLQTERLVVKPDQLFGKRGKYGLICIDVDWPTAWAWIAERMNKPVTVGKAMGNLTHFLIEPFRPHAETEEFFLAIRPEQEEDILYFSLHGGIFVEENWDKVSQTKVPVLTTCINEVTLNLPELGVRREAVIDFIRAVYRFYAEAGLNYLEINPFTFSGNSIVPLDLVAKMDDTAAFECRQIWGELEFPSPFGTASTPEELFVKALDAKSGASLKLTILNPKGRVWLMVAGGGASVIYTDTVCDLGYSGELANYGEYSGNPTTEGTYQYAKTILDLMTREKDPAGKVLLIGGGIANFTDVAKTFTGIVQALQEYKDRLIENRVKIFVRRGGPNYQQGLSIMRKLGQTLGVQIEVYGPETHMTKIVSMALKGGQA
jgi:ATP-citrate lyase beta-subunit